MIVVTTIGECRSKLSDSAMAMLRQDSLSDSGCDPLVLDDDTPIAISRRDLLRYGMNDEFHDMSSQVQVLGHPQQ